MEAIAKAVLLVFIGVPMIFAITAAAMLWRAYVATILWGWFVVPFFGLPQLSLAFAIGVTLVIGLISGRGMVSNYVQDEKKKWYPLASLVFGPALTLLMGWVAKQYV